MFKKIQEEYKKSKLFFIIKALLTIITIYFAVRVIFIAILGLLNSNPLPSKMYLLLFAMLFSLGLSSVVKIVEMSIYKEKEYFILHLASAIFILSVSVFILLV